MLITSSWLLKCFYYIRKHYVCLGCCSIIFYCLWPSRFASYYDYIPSQRIHETLLEKTTSNLSASKQQTRCEYDEIIEENKFMARRLYRTDVFDNEEIRSGGEYVPEDCLPKFSTAILVPYRQREKQLNEFLIYMHNFLRKQRIHYRIFIIEQFDQKPFNRAKLFNIGAVYAMKYDFPCIVLHDVDLMPMNLGHLYACSERPRHMCASLDKFRFHLPYYELFGGAVAIDSETFSKINGMSNIFYGWGGEDDDLYRRLRAKNVHICRFPPNYNQYSMLRHKPETPNADRLEYLQSGALRYHSDGLNSLIFEEKGFKMHSLFTHVLVET